MDLNTILIALAVLVGLVVIVRIVGTIFRVALAAIAIGLLYFWFTGRNITSDLPLPNIDIFKNRTISELHRDYCTGQPKEKKSITCHIVSYKTAHKQLFIFFIYANL